MKPRTASHVTRRRFLQTALPVGPLFIFADRPRAWRSTLRILQWAHFAPGYDQWFDELAAAWGRTHRINVRVDRAPLAEMSVRALGEARRRRGHDLVLFPWPPASYQKHLIDHCEVYEEVALRQGQVVKLGHRSTFNPKTKRYFAFADSFVPAAFNYVKDYWSAIGYSFGPTSYESLRLGASQIRRELGIPCGLGLAPELDSAVWLEALLWSFGASVQDADGNVSINSKRTVGALNFVKALQADAGSPEVFSWDPSSNDRAMLSGKVSCAVNAISITRQAEAQQSEMSARIMVNPALRGPVAWLACPHITNCWAIWEFAANKRAAKQFLVHFADNLGAAFRASGYCNFPCFPKTVPDLRPRLENDPQAEPKHKYATLADTLFWTVNLGHPGYATPAIAEVFNAFVVPRMFAAVARNQLSPEAAAAAAEQEVKHIFGQAQERRM